MIDYQIISDSCEFYAERGFKRIESPWTVTKAISDITNPTSNNFTIVEKNKVLVASGEQSFLSMYNKGFLPAGRFFTITPCYRNDAFDETHTKYFMKNELIQTDIVDQKELISLVDICYKFFQSYIPNHHHLLTTIKTPSGYDIMLNGIEIGSYGIRKCSFLKWIYGTGLAEPRFSRILWDITNKK